MAELSYTLTAKEQDLLAKLNKVNQAQDDLIGKLRNQNKEAKNTSSTFDGVASAVRGYLTVGVGIAFVTKLLSDQQRVAKEASQRMDQLADGTRRFITIARTPAELKSFEESASRLAKGFGLPEKRAQQIVSETVQAGFPLREADTFAKVAKFTPDIGAVIGSVDAIKDAFKEDVGDVMSIVNTVGELLGERTAPSFEALAESIKANIDVGKEIGGSFAEIAALTTVLLGEREPEKVQTQVRAVLARLLKLGLFDPSKGLIENLEPLLDPKSRASRLLLKESRGPGARLGLSAIQRNFAEIKNLTGTAEVAALGGSFVSSRLAAVAAKPELVAEAVESRAKTKLEESAFRVAKGREEKERVAVIDTVTERIEASGQGGLAQGVQKAALSTAKLLGASKETLAGIGGPFFGAAAEQRTQSVLQEALGKLAFETEQNTAAVKEQNVLLKTTPLPAGNGQAETRGNRTRRVLNELRIGNEE